MNSELMDLLILLAIICVPILAFGVAFNLRGPLGRALAARTSRAPERDQLAAFEARLETRLASLERAVEAIAASIVGGCTQDLRTQVEPRNRTVRVGESYTAAASAWGCSGTRLLSDEWRYFAVDTAIARVDSVTGRVTARAVGTTDVGARGTRYGDASNRSRVTVTQ